MKKLASLRKSSKQRLDDDEGDGSFSGSAIMPGGGTIVVDVFGSTGPSRRRPAFNSACGHRLTRSAPFSFNRLRRKGSSVGGGSAGDEDRVRVRHVLDAVRHARRRHRQLAVLATCGERRRRAPDA